MLGRNWENMNYKTCTRCIMDTSDPEIRFDKNGICNHCARFDELARNDWFPNEEGSRRLEAIVAKIKQEGRGKEYDCALGLSGGVDSSYLAYKAKEFGLRPLVIHVDAGWNSELAVNNIENICKELEYDLHTHVVDWEAMRDLQVAFLRSGVPNQDAPQDHAFFVALYSFAVKNNIRYVLNGSNIATESILPQSWGYNAMDARFLQGIHRRFGTGTLAGYPTVSFFQYHVYYPYIRRMQVVRMLNYLHYNRDEAKKLLVEKLGWKDYGAKHYESRFTKFFQGYFLPTRFGYDKRRAHLSSLVVSGQMSREDALVEMAKAHYPESEQREDRAYVIKKLGLTDEEFEKLLRMPLKSHLDYPSNAVLYQKLIRIRSMLRGK